MSCNNMQVRAPQWSRTANQWNLYMRGSKVSGNGTLPRCVSQVLSNCQGYVQGKGQVSQKKVPAKRLLVIGREVGEEVGGLV